jgi:hypothetical protein
MPSLTWAQNRVLRAPLQHEVWKSFPPGPSPQSPTPEWEPICPWLKPGVVRVFQVFQLRRLEQFDRMTYEERIHEIPVNIGDYERGHYWHDSR